MLVSVVAALSHSSIQVQIEALKCLCSLARNGMKNFKFMSTELLRTKLEELKLINKLISLVSSENATIREMCLWVVCFMLPAESAKKEMLLLGGVHKLMVLLKHKELQQPALWCLTRLMTGNGILF
jgi:hypothetical protein